MMQNYSKVNMLTIPMQWYICTTFVVYELNKSMTIIIDMFFTT